MTSDNNNIIRKFSSNLSDGQLNMNDMYDTISIANRPFASMSFSDEYLPTHLDHCNSSQQAPKLPCVDDYDRISTTSSETTPPYDDTTILKANNHQATCYHKNEDEIMNDYNTLLIATSENDRNEEGNDNYMATGTTNISDACDDTCDYDTISLVGSEMTSQYPNKISEDASISGQVESNRISKGLLLDEAISMTDNYALSYSNPSSDIDSREVYENFLSANARNAMSYLQNENLSAGCYETIKESDNLASNFHSNTQLNPFHKTIPDNGQFTNTLRDTYENITNEAAQNYSCEKSSESMLHENYESTLTSKKTQMDLYEDISLMEDRVKYLPKKVSLDQVSDDDYEDISSATNKPASENLVIISSVDCYENGTLQTNESIVITELAEVISCNCFLESFDICDPV